MRLSVWFAALCLGAVALAQQETEAEASPVSGSDSAADTPADPTPVEEAPEEDDSARPKRWYYPPGYNYGYPWNNANFGPGNYPVPPVAPGPTGRTRPGGAGPRVATFDELVNFQRFNDIAYQQDRHRQWMHSQRRNTQNFPDVIDTAANNFGPNFNQGPNTFNQQRPNFNQGPNTFNEVSSRTRGPGPMQTGGSFNAPFFAPDMRTSPSNFNPNVHPAFNPASNFNPNFNPRFQQGFNYPGALPPSFPY